MQYSQETDSVILAGYIIKGNNKSIDIHVFIFSKVMYISKAVTICDLISAHVIIRHSPLTSHHIKPFCWVQIYCYW